MSITDTVDLCPIFKGNLLLDLNESIKQSFVICTLFMTYAQHLCVLESKVRMSNRHRRFRHSKASFGVTIQYFWLTWPLNAWSIGFLNTIQNTMIIYYNKFDLLAPTRRMFRKYNLKAYLYVLQMQCKAFCFWYIEVLCWSIFYGCIYIIFYLFFRFHDIPSEIIGSAKYSWNPCNAFTEGTTCINVTVKISIY